jgi:hypothetical protein
MHEDYCFKDASMNNTLTWAGEAGFVLQVLDLRRLPHDGHVALSAGSTQHTGRPPASTSSARWFGNSVLITDALP